MPESEPALSELAAAATAVGRTDRALEACAILIRLNPTAVESYITRATVLVNLRRYAEAEADCRTALRIHPLHPTARLLLGVCRHHQGDPAGGKREAAAAAALATSPGQRTALHEWYAQRTR
jgi:tetratricopeptide (TPR) repeat protein